jgi:tetratricopeptide (TPR) repeat protein
MATKVNTKFVIGLLAVMLIAVGGVGYLAMRAFAGSSDRLAAQGEAAMQRYHQAVAAGDTEEARKAIREAASSYERAVGKESTRVDLLEKWQEALLLVTPNSPTDAERLYRWYLLIPRSVAVNKPEDPTAALEYFSLLWAELESVDSIPGLERLMTEVEALSRRYPATHPATHRVLSYKGKAIVRMMHIGPVEPARVEAAQKILEDAVQALPDEPDAVLWLARWHIAAATTARNDRQRQAQATTHLQKAHDLIAQGVERFPEAIELKLLALDLKRQEVAPQGNQAAIEVLTPLVRDLIKTQQRQPIESLDPRLVMVIGQYAQAMGLTDAVHDCNTMLEDLAKRQPTKPRPLLALAQMYERQRDYPRQIEAAGRVLALPDPTVGLDSRSMPTFRRLAAQLQVDATLALLETATDPAQKAELDKQATAFMEKLVPLVPSTHGYLLSDRRGRMAMLRNNAAEAVALLADAVKGYEAAGASVPMVTMRSLAAALEQTNATGEAIQAWRRVLAQSAESNTDDPMARLRIGRLAMEMQDLQTALNELNTAAALLPGSSKAPALFAMAQVYERLIDRQQTVTINGTTTLTPQEMIARAMETYQQLERLSPGNEQVEAGIARLRARTGQGDNPELIAAIQAGQHAERGDLEAALRTLTAAIDAGHGSVRLWTMRIDLLVRLGQSEQALAAAQQAASLYPNDQNIARYLRIAQADDPAEVALQDITDPFQRAIARYQVAVSRSDEREMQDALAEARRIDPDHTLVLELDFEQAIRARDWDRAGVLARRAGERNLDQVEGRLYQGRLHYARGHYNESIQVLRQAVQKMEFNPTAWRLLGLSQMQLGRTNEAVSSLQRALQGRPSDFDIARDYANALVRVGRGADALAVVDNTTGVLRFGRRSPEMVELWLDLASRFGGPEGERTALIERRAMFDRDPSNLVNAARLTEALFDSQNWGEAQKVIDTLAGTPGANPVTAAMLRARLLHRQGRTPEAAASFESFLAADPARQESAEALIAFSDLLFELGMDERGVEMLKLAHQKSAPGQTLAARKLANTYFQGGVQTLINARQIKAQGAEAQAAEATKAAARAIDEALSLYRAVLQTVDAQADPADAAAIGMLIVEGHLQLERLDEAERALNQLTALGSDDLRRSVAMARISALRGDKRRANQIMDQAILTHPNTSSAFLNRARINADNPQMIQDVLADLERAIELQPTNMEAWQIRVALLRDRGEMDRALAALRSAIQINPNQDTLTAYLVDTLLSAGRYSEAASEAIAQANRKPADRDLQLRTIVLLQQINFWPEAATLLARLRESEPGNPFFAASWLDCMVNANARLTPAEAMPVLRIVRTAPAYNTPSEPFSWAITEAKVLYHLRGSAGAQAQRFADEAKQAVRRALGVMPQQLATARIWLQVAG